MLFVPLCEFYFGVSSPLFGVWNEKKISGKTIFNVSVILISLVMLGYFCLSENGLVELSKNFKNLDKGWLIMALLSQALNIAIDAYMTYILVKSSVPSFKFHNALKTSMVGQFFSAVTPFATGGQPMQVYCMSKYGVEPGKGVSALTQKFVVYQSTLVAYSAAALLLKQDFFDDALSGVMWTFAVFGFLSQAFVILMLLLFSFSRRLTNAILGFAKKLLTRFHRQKLYDKLGGFERQLESFHDCNKELYKNRRLVVTAYVCTAVQLTAIFIIPYCVYRSFNLSGAPVSDMICSQAFVTMATCFIPLPGAAGASEISFLGFFSMYFTPETLKSGVLVWRIITYYLVILCTAPFSRLGKKPEEKRKRKPDSCNLVLPERMNLTDENCSP